MDLERNPPPYAISIASPSTRIHESTRELNKTTPVEHPPGPCWGPGPKGGMSCFLLISIKLSYILVHGGYCSPSQNVIEFLRLHSRSSLKQRSPTKHTQVPGTWHWSGGAAGTGQGLLPSSQSGNRTNLKLSFAHTSAMSTAMFIESFTTCVRKTISRLTIEGHPMGLPTRTSAWVRSPCP